MLRKAIIIGLFPLALTSGLTLAPGVQAFGIHKAELLVTASVQGEGLTKEQAASRAKARYGGKVLSVNESASNGKKIFRVKLLLDSGRIKIVTVKS